MGFFDEMRSAGETAAQAGQQHLAEQKIARETDAMWNQKEDAEKKEEKTEEKEVARQTKQEVKAYYRERRQKEREEAKLRRQEAREARRVKRQETIQEIRKNIGDGWNKTKELTSQVGQGVKTARDIFVGITQTEEGKQAVREAVEKGIDSGLQKLAETKDRTQEWTLGKRDEILDFVFEKGVELGRGVENIWHSAMAKKDELITETKNKISETREAFRNNILNPFVDKSKAVGTAAINGAKTAGLFTAGLVISGVEAGIQGGKYVVEKTKEGAIATKDFSVEQFNKAVEKATEWKNNLVAFSTNQADIFSRNIQAEYNVIQASFADIKAAPAEIISKFSGKLAEHLSGISQRNIEKAWANREKSASCRRLAETLRPNQSEVNE